MSASVCRRSTACPSAPRQAVRSSPDLCGLHGRLRPAQLRLRASHLLRMHLRQQPWGCVISARKPQPHVPCLRSVVFTSSTHPSLLCEFIRCVAFACLPLSMPSLLLQPAIQAADNVFCRWSTLCVASQSITGDMRPCCAADVCLCCLCARLHARFAVRSGRVMCPLKDFFLYACVVFGNSCASCVLSRMCSRSLVYTVFAACRLRL